MNRIFLLLFGAVTFVAYAQAQVPDYVPTEGLVAWYPMNGELTNEVNQDELNLLMGGNFVTGQDNVEEGALSFSEDSWAEIHPLIGTTETLTVHLWINEGTNPPNEMQTALYLGQEGFLGDTTSSLDITRDRVNFPGDGRLRSNLNFDFGHVGFDELDGGWVHVVSVFDSGVLSIYRNGILQQSTTASVSGISIYGTSMLGAGHIGTNPEPFNFCHCALDNIGIWNRALTEQEILALYNAQLPIPGCTDSTACNYNDEANEDDGTCTYPPFGLADCEAGGALCGEGTIWDASLQACVGFNECPSDLDGDGVIGVNDLMQLLSTFGTDCPEAGYPSGDPETAEWTCGGPVNYHSYDYATVQIGDQCWFAENLRTEHYTNGDAIPANLSDGEWAVTASGAAAVYGEDAGCENWSPDGDACDPAWSLNEYGRLYNWYAVDDGRELCPTGWHVPTDGEWMTLEMALGMGESEANNEGFRGTDQGTQMKTTYGWYAEGNGTNLSGFSGLPGGLRNVGGPFIKGGQYSFWWSSSPAGSYAFYRSLWCDLPKVERLYTDHHLGFSVRCLRDAE